MSNSGPLFPYNQESSQQVLLVGDVVDRAMERLDGIAVVQSAALPMLSPVKRDEIVVGATEAVDAILSPSEKKEWWHNANSDPVHERLTKIAGLVANYAIIDLLEGPKTHGTRWHRDVSAQFRSSGYPEYYASRFMSAVTLRKHMKQAGDDGMTG
jgi:hypothetical protein